MEFLGLFWFVGVFFTIIVRRFYGGLLEGYKFPKSRFSVQAFRFFAVGFEPFRTIECFFPMGFPGLESRRNEGFPDRSKRSVLSLRRSLSYVLFLSKGAFASQIGSTSLSLPFIQVFAFFFEFFCIGRRKSRISGIRTPKLRSSGLFLPRVSALFYRSILYGN